MGKGSLYERIKYGFLVLYGVGCFIYGRFYAPDKVKIEKEIVYKEDLSRVHSLEAELKRQKSRTTDILRYIHPDGFIEERISEREMENLTHLLKEQETLKSSRGMASSEKKETTSSGRIISISGLAASSIHEFKKIEYGVHVQSTVIGPINVGVFGISNGSVGASIGIVLK